MCLSCKFETCPKSILTNNPKKISKSETPTVNVKSFKNDLLPFACPPSTLKYTSRDPINGVAAVPTASAVDNE